MNYDSVQNEILFSDENRSPSYSVHRYITYLKKLASDVGKTVSAHQHGEKADKKKNVKSEVIKPLSYFLRKLKLDLKTSYENFVSDFVVPPYNGLQLLISLLKSIHGLSGQSVRGSSRGSNSTTGSLHIEDYKQNMVDELDCLLCIKYTMRVEKSVDQMLEDNTGILTIVMCCLSNFHKSRIAALEITTLLITGPSAVDMVLEAFTAIRVQYSESTRFKMLVNMLYTRGVDNVMFQICTLRLLNCLLNMCKSPNMRVFLQYELEEAGLDLTFIQESSQKHGLQFDDLSKQIQEWKTRYIDVNFLLKRIKNDMRRDFVSQAVSDYTFDQHYGRQQGGPKVYGGNNIWIPDKNHDELFGHTREWTSGQTQIYTGKKQSPSQEIVYYKGKDIYITSHMDQSVHQLLTRQYKDRRSDLNDRQTVNNKDSVINIDVGKQNQNLFSWQTQEIQRKEQYQPHLQYHHHHRQQRPQQPEHQTQQTQNIRETNMSENDIYSEPNSHTTPLNTPVEYDSIWSDSVVSSNISNGNNNTRERSVEIDKSFTYDGNWVFKKSSEHDKAWPTTEHDKTKYDAPTNDTLATHNKVVDHRQTFDNGMWSQKFEAQHIFYTGPVNDDEDNKDFSGTYLYSHINGSGAKKESETPIHRTALVTEKSIDNDLDAENSKRHSNFQANEKPGQICQISAELQNRGAFVRPLPKTVDGQTNNISGDLTRTVHSRDDDTNKKLSAISNSSPHSPENKAESSDIYDKEVSNILKELDRTLELHGGSLREPAKPRPPMQMSKTFMAYI